VTSRTSANLYKGDKPRNSREIGQQLGVAHLLEGNVQRAGNRMRINAQLIDARTDTHVWSQTYDRDLTDVFTIQSEVAHKVADVLQAKLTGREQQVAGKKPTENLDAYDAYLRGIVLEAQAGESLETFPRLVELYTKAVKLDPKFAQAWARLSIRHIYSYSLFDHTPKRLAEAKEAVDTALRLQPDLGEAYQALGYYYYLGLHDFEAALHAYEQARQRLPNNAALTLLIGEVKRRQGKMGRSCRVAGACSATRSAKHTNVVGPRP
jgi:tetratricopeptide (TPR) repeat protein